jgi:hypothetical protein
MQPGECNHQRPMVELLTGLRAAAAQSFTIFAIDFGCPPPVGALPIR